MLHSSTYEKYKDPELTVQEDLKEKHESKKTKTVWFGSFKDISTLVSFADPSVLHVYAKFHSY